MTTNLVHDLNEMYFSWLTQQVYINYRHQTLVPFDDLLKVLWAKPFPWTVTNDENRVEDGLELRYLFMIDESFHTQFQALQFKTEDLEMHRAIVEFRKQPCSILEVLIALSRRLAFNEGGDAGWWAWKLINNLELHKYRDPLTPRKMQRVTDILDNLVWRTYNPDGTGGFFPLAYPREDQRKVEIWYQMNAFLEEFGHP